VESLDVDGRFERRDRFVEPFGEVIEQVSRALVRMAGSEHQATKRRVQVSGGELPLVPGAGTASRAGCRS
jgi:hypothetical protein